MVVRKAHGKQQRCEQYHYKSTNQWSMETTYLGAKLFQLSFTLVGIFSGALLVTGVFLL